MNEQQTIKPQNPKWIATTSTLLLGSLLLIYTSFYSIIYASIVIDKIGVKITSTTGIYIIIALSILLGFGVAVFVGKKAFKWFSNFGKVKGIVLMVVLMMVVLMFLALAFIPQLSTYVIR